jgi:gliding motility-associated-like protein
MIRSAPTKFIFYFCLLITSLIKAELPKWLIHETSGQLHLVDFTSGSPVVTTPLIPYGVTGDEDVNLMTDINNNIIFSYVCDGAGNIEVRDRNWAIMSNGTGLLSHNSSLKSCIVKIPCSTDKYYVVHLVTGAGFGNLYYSVIDMSANGGLGAVTLKNIPLGNGYDEGLSISHQMRNGCRWLVCSKSVGSTHEVYRFLVSNIDIGSPALITTLNYTSAAGFGHDLEISPDNRMVAMATNQSDPSSPDVVVWDFDLEAGTFSNRRDFSVSPQPSMGVEFSPDITKVYWRTNIPTDNSELGRIDLLTNTSALINTNFGRYGTAIETASNGKLYMTHNYNIGYLSEIANPNAPNLANIGFTYNAVLISPNGCRVGIPNSIDGESPGYTTVPTSIDFTASATANCNEYIFVDSSCLSTWREWDFGDGTFSNVESPVHQYTSAGNYTVTLRQLVCSDTLVKSKSNFISVQVSTLTLTANTSICAGSSVPLSVSGSNSYVWSPSTGLNQTTGTNVVSTPVSNTTYTVTGTDLNGCTSTSTVTVTIIQPTAVITPDGPLTFCEGGSVQLTANSGSLYQWSTNENTQSITVDSGGNYIVSVYTSNCVASDTITIVVLPAPTAFWNSLPNINICQGDSAFISINTSANNVLQWEYNGQVINGAVSFSIYANMTGSYTALVTAVNGCTTSLSSSVNVSSMPVAAFIIPAVSCTQNVLIENQSTDATGYFWSYGDGNVSTMFESNHNYTSAGTYTVELIATNNNCYDTTTSQIIIDEIPVAEFGRLSNCGYAQYFQNSSANALSYTWSFGDGDSAFITDPVHIYSVPGQYMITLAATSTNGCISVFQREIDIAVNVPAVFNFTYDTCSATATFYPSFLIANSYNWNFDNNDSLSGILYPEYHFDHSGPFTVSLITNVGFDCMNIDSLTLNIPEIPEETMFLPTAFTPNADGVNDIFRAIGNSGCSEFEIFIYNRWGEMIFESKNIEKGWDGKYNGNNVPSDVYCYLIRKNDSTYKTGSVLVMH